MCRMTVCVWFQLAGGSADLQTMARLFWAANTVQYFILPVNIGHNHWVLYMFDWLSLPILYLDGFQHACLELTAQVVRFCCSYLGLAHDTAS